MSSFCLAKYQVNTVFVDSNGDRTFALVPGVSAFGEERPGQGRVGLSKRGFQSRVVWWKERPFGAA
jgi:hypothetical protein